MANHWLRLWHDMPNDPKWRTVSRISKQPISVVLAVYVHLLVEASRNVTRGHAAVTSEDLASALDVGEAEIQSVIDAMQGRLLDGMNLLGWEKRQPKREDSGDQESGTKTAAQRKAEQRAREKAALELALSESGVTQGHDKSHDVTLDKDKDKDKEEKTKAPATPLPEWVPPKAWADYLKMRKSIKKPLTGEGIPLALAKLEKLKTFGHAPKDVLEQSILNSWQGLFEVKRGGPDAEPPKKDWE